jgi:hypothetical protein
MEDSSFATLFGPLSREYCLWFYWLAVLGFIFLLLTVISGVMVIFSEKKVKFEMIHSVVMTAIMYGIFYFQNRLLYSMCQA